MKFLAILSLVLFLTACDDELPSSRKPAKQEDLKYKAGDLVLIHNEPFFDNCYGFVVDFESEKEEKRDQFYKVAVFCRSTGPLGKVIIAPE